MMKYIMSLEHNALVKVAFILWNQEDIKALISNYHFGNVPSTDREEWDKIEEKVMGKVPQLTLPVFLRENLSCFVKCVGTQLYKWLQCCTENGNVCMKLLNGIVWTPQGTIDRKKTAKALFKDTTIHILIRYKLADALWLMDDIPELWNQIPEDQRKHILNKHEQLQLMVPKRNAVPYLLLDSSDEEDGEPVESEYRHVLEMAAAEDPNQAAVEYLLPTLPARERKEALPSIAAAVAMKICDGFSAKPYTDVLWFLFSEMSERQQIELFKRYPIPVCKCLLEYPNQSLFMETVSHMWSHFQGISFYWILEMIIHKVFDGYRDYNYKMLFRQFWRQSPPVMKRFVLDGPYMGRLLNRLCHIKDRESVRLILESMVLADKNKLTSSEIPKCISRCMMYFDDWDFLDVFVKECVSSKDEMIRFVEDLKAYITQLYSEECNLATDEEKKHRLFLLLDDLVSQYNKRKSTEDDVSHPTKELCSAKQQVDSRASQ